VVRTGNGHRPGAPSSRRPEQPALPLPVDGEEHLDIGALETWLWDAACAIRGATDAPEFKDFILPLVFFKRLSDVFDDELARFVARYGDRETTIAIVEEDHKDALANARKPIIRFHVDHRYRWDSIRKHPTDGALGEFVTEATRIVAWDNPDLQSVLDVKDYNER